MTANSAIKYPAMCGGVGGLVTATSTIAKTLCSKWTFSITRQVSTNSYVKLLSILAKSQPFRIEFITDSFELGETNAESTTKGFSLKYWQNSC